MTPAEQIKKLREQLGMHQGQLAEVMGVMQHHVNRWERGHVEPQGENAAKLQWLVDNQAKSHPVNVKGKTMIIDYRIRLKKYVPPPKPIPSDIPDGTEDDVVN